MKLSTFVSLTLLAAGGLFANDLQQVADNLQVQSPAANSKRITIPRVRGAEVSILGVDYEQLVNEKGTILTRPACDTPVRISFKVISHLTFTPGPCITDPS